MRSIVELTLFQFCLVYLLLVVVLAIMKKSQIRQTHMLFIASFRMTLQLVIAGLVLTLIFDNPHPLFTVAYLTAMIIFAINRVYSRVPEISKAFKKVVALSLSASGLLIILFFVKVVVGESLFNPQYVIPLSGMIMGNAMTGVSLGVKTFHEKLKDNRHRIQTLLNFGASPSAILKPIANQSLETALLPTLNSMVGMGIVSLPGMMTGQILSGTLPKTAIMYQIAIMIAICTVVALASFLALYLGYHTFYDTRDYDIKL